MRYGERLVSGVLWTALGTDIFFTGFPLIGDFVLGSDSVLGLGASQLSISGELQGVELAQVRMPSGRWSTCVW